MALFDFLTDLGSGIIGSIGSSKGTDTVVNNLGKGIAIQSGAYNQIRSDFSPWAATGANAMTQLASALGLPSGGSFAGGSGYVSDVYGGQGAGAGLNPTQLMTALKANVGKGYDQAFVDKIQGMIDSGQSPGAITGVLNAWASTTTSKENQQAVQAIMGATTAGGGGTATGGGGTATGGAGAGGTATGAPYGGFQQSPGYQWAFDQGVKAVDAGAATKGLLGSGARLKALTTFGQGLANQEYYNYLGKLYDLSRMGQSAVGAVSDAGLHTADMSTKAYSGIGDAKAGNATNQANIWGDVWGGATTGSGGGFGGSPLDKLFKMDWG